jgi:hypothetical protein
VVLFGDKPWASKQPDKYQSKHKSTYVSEKCYPRTLKTDTENTA